MAGLRAQHQSPDVQLRRGHRLQPPLAEGVPRRSGGGMQDGRRGLQGGLRQQVGWRQTAFRRRATSAESSSPEIGLRMYSSAPSM